MDWQCLGKNWLKTDSAKLEEAFRESLKKLDAEGATNREIADTVIGSSFILGLIWVVTSSGSTKKLNTRYGRAPGDWERWLGLHDLREDWRSETVELLRRKCERDGMLDCRLEEKGIGRYWRQVIIDKAIKAAWKLLRRNICKVRRGKHAQDVSGVSDQDGIGKPRSKRLTTSLIDFRIDASMATDGVEDVPQQAATRIYLVGSEYQEVAHLVSDELHQDLMMLIHELKSPREREVLRLSLLGHSYRNIERILAEENGPSGKILTFDMVRYAHEKGIASLQERLGLAA